MGTSTPQDATLVHRAVRLGWTLAEVGGRYRHLAATGQPTPRTELGPNMLPLAAERSEQEQAIQAEQSLGYISQLLKLDPPASSLSQMPKDVQGAASEYLRVTLKTLTRAAQPSAARTKRVETADHILAVWDAHIQDQLHGQSLAAHAGYQVGRAFADRYRDVMDGVTGRPHDKQLWGIRMTGADALSFGAEVQFPELGNLCRRIEQAHARDDHKERFQLLDDIQPVTDPELRLRLCEEVTSRLRDERSSEFELAPPEILDYAQVAAFGTTLTDSPRFSIPTFF